MLISFDRMDAETKKEFYMKKLFKKNKAITLIALVITIALNNFGVVGVN